VVGVTPAAVAQTPPTDNGDGTFTNSDGTVTVPFDWALIPDGLGSGDKFRLLFITSTSRNAQAAGIGTYDSFVRTRAAAGHPAIQGHASTYRVVGSTSSVDARVHVRMRSSDVVAPVYWLGGKRISQNYGTTAGEGFWASSWENRAEGDIRDERGRSVDQSTPGLALRNKSFVWTGTQSSGTKKPNSFLGRRFGTVAAGRIFGHSPFATNVDEQSFTTYPLYGVSPVYVVPSVASERVAEVVGAPRLYSAGGWIACMLSRGRGYGIPQGYCGALASEDTAAAYIENFDGERDVIDRQVLNVPCGNTGRLRIRTMNWRFDSVLNPKVWLIATDGSNLDSTGPSKARLRTSAPYVTSDGGTKLRFNGDYGLGIPIASHAGERVHELEFTVDSRGSTDWAFQLLASRDSSQSYRMLGGHRAYNGVLYDQLKAAYGPKVIVRMQNPGQDCPTAESSSSVPQTEDDGWVLPQGETDSSEDNADPSYTVPASLISDVHSYAAETGNGDAHVRRWKRVLVAFGESVPGFTGTPMTATEAQSYADKGWSRWYPVVTALTALEAQPSPSDTTDNNPPPADPQPADLVPVDPPPVDPQPADPLSDTEQDTQQQLAPSYTVPAQLISDVQGYAAETGNGDAHVTRWKRVLLAFGETVPGFTGTPVTVVEAQGFANQFWNVRWDPVVAALTALQTNQQQQPQQQHPDPTPADPVPVPVPADPDPDPVPADPVPPPPPSPLPVSELPVLSITDGSFTEGSRGGYYIFFVSLSESATGPVQVRYRVETTGTGAGHATDDIDYVSVGSSVHLRPGINRNVGLVIINDDTDKEPDETLRIVLTDPQNAQIGNGEAIVTIKDND